MKKIVLACVVGLIGVAVAAEPATPANPTTNEAEGRGRWHLTVGPAWRARVKTEISGAASVESVSASRTSAKESGGRVVVRDPVQEPAGATLYADTETVTETIVTPGGGAAAMGATDERRPLGVKAKFGYDVWANDMFAVALDLRFAGYWNIKSSASGAAHGGSMTVRRTTDYYLYENGPYPGDSDFEYAYPDEDPYLPYRETSDETTFFASQVRGARLTADLYQIGIGPSVTWHALSWLDAYAGVAALCNIASLDFDVGSQGSSETQCRFGLAAEAGLAAYVTDNVGLYAEVGYEWIDRFSADGGGASARLDFSSLVVGAGLVVRW